MSLIAASTKAKVGFRQGSVAAMVVLAGMIAFLLLGVAPVVAQTATPAPAAAVISSSIISGDPCTLGSQFTVRVAVTENATGQIPNIAVFRVYYDPSAVRYAGATDGDLGAAYASDEHTTFVEGVPYAFRFFVTAGNPENSDPTPVILDLGFQVVSPRPHSIDVRKDGSNPTNQLATGPGKTPIPHTVVSDGTMDLCSSLPTPTASPTPTPSPTPHGQPAVISSSIISGDPCTMGSQFTVRVAVTENGTGQVPTVAGFRVYYDGTAVHYVGATNGDLGIAYGSREYANTVAGLPPNYRNCGASGNSGNQDSTPVILDLRFQVTSPRPHSIVLRADAFETDLSEYPAPKIPHVFASGATTGLCSSLPTPTPSPVPTPTVTPTPTPTPNGQPAVMATSILSGDPCTAGSEFTVRVAVTENATGRTPIAALVRLHYDPQAVAFVAALPADLGTTALGPERTTTTAGLPSMYRLIATNSNYDNDDLTPVAMDVVFRVVGPQSTSIVATDDTNADHALIDKNFTGMPHVFSNDATVGLCEPPGDADRDGLENRREAALGTDPADRDTDRDGFEDGVEVSLGTNPLDANDPPAPTDGDSDGIPDSLDNDSASPDADGDGYRDGYEFALGSNPGDSASHPDLGDADGDGHAEFADAVMVFNLHLGNYTAKNSLDGRITDVNRDGYTDFVDGVILINWYLGNIPYLPY